MKKWSLIVAGLYGLIFLILIGPLAWIAFGPKSFPDFSEMPKALVTWELWLIVTIMVIAQFALLRIPVHLAGRRPVAHRSLLTTITAAAFMMGLLVFSAAVSIYEFITRLQGDTGFWLSVTLGVASWLFWAVYFYRSTRSVSPDKTMDRLRRFMWTGSILELLVAIPTHIVARQRDYCCAGGLTFIGLTCGLSVMLFAFGPAVYFLFADRWKRLHPMQQQA